MKRILIANRGEIACRIIKSCKNLGYQSIAVYSDVDKNAKHVRMADEKYHIGPSKSQESYLSYKKIIDVALKNNVDAIHPGFGFLSENATFASEVIKNKILWVGPKPETIKSMGNKDIARELAEKSNVPICPGIDNIFSLSQEDLQRRCESIGYPILVKASAGGGGIGMNVVNNFLELESAIEKTSSLAQKAFGDGSIFLEKFITNARHIEIQIFGFGKNGSVHLYERDCSMQRRYQKIIEESPAPNIERCVIDEMADAAVKLASYVNYDGAGTVEFLVDKNSDFYLMEMNTRIQVEHTITEEVIDYDLIKEQIKIAFGEKISGKNYYPTMHAIQCRINAEDPYNDFRPSPGKITSYHSPGGNGVRIDTHVYAGYTIPPNYDSMIAKLITVAQTREEAILKMKRALEEYVIEGVKTTIPFHLKLMDNPDFRAGNFTTKFMETFEF